MTRIANLKADDFAGQQCVPMVFVPLVDPADEDQPGILQPIRTDLDGNVLVALGGAGGAPILLPDDVDGVAAVATLTRVPTVARNYIWDPFLEEFNRWRAASDDVEAQAPDSDFNAGVVETRPRLYNASGDLWLRAKSNDNQVVLASAARTATVSSATFNNVNFRGGQFIIDVTAVPGAAPSVVFSIEARDATSGTFFSLLDSVAIVAVGQTVLRVYPGLTAVANLVASDLLPWQWRVTATHGNANSITYSVGANLML
jgi:hypothetical protein